NSNHSLSFGISKEGGKMSRALLLILILNLCIIFQGCAVLEIVERIDGSTEEEIRRIRIPKHEVWNEVDKYKAENTNLRGQIDALMAENEKITDKSERRISALIGQNKALNRQLNESREENEKHKATHTEVRNVPDTPQEMAYSLQVGAFSSKQFAESRKAILIEMGYKARLVQISDRTGKVWNTVRIGDYAGREDALEAAAAFSEREKMAIAVLPFGSF
ncbi:MAG: SPOR domain-containing protein, partial [Desulfobacterales bacterium]